MRLWFSLADRQGKTVAALQREMTHSEFIHWLAFDRMKMEEEAEMRNRLHHRETPVTSRDAALDLKRRRGL